MSPRDLSSDNTRVWQKSLVADSLKLVMGDNPLLRGAAAARLRRKAGTKHRLSKQSFALQLHFDGPLGCLKLNQEVQG
jgi:hypothetical protein